MKTAKFALINHTADIGIIAYGKTLQELFENAAYGMFHSMIDTFDKIRQKKSITVEVTGNDYESLLVNFLNEFVYLSTTKRMLFCNFKINTFNKFFIQAEAKGEEITKKHKLNFEIKAATYHNLKIQQSPEGEYHTQIIFDV
ncbi:MAG: archease [Elusimicrobiota bacterium]|nr:archease [Elusimicrobiota bacterium]